MMAMIWRGGDRGGIHKGDTDGCLNSLRVHHLYLDVVACRHSWAHYRPLEGPSPLNTVI